MTLKRELGVFESVNSSGTEFRLYEVDPEHVVRVPWHCDPHTGEWYEGIKGPPIRTAALIDLLSDDFVPPGWDAPLSDVIADFRDAVVSARAVEETQPNAGLRFALDIIAARGTNLIDVARRGCTPTGREKFLVEATTLDLIAVVTVALKHGRDPIARMRELLGKIRADE